MTQYRILDNDQQKRLVSLGYNYSFCKQTGFFARWGTTPQDDPEWCRFGPELLDIEISTVCHQGCRFCYKGNGVSGVNMSLQTLTRILDLMPPTLTQVAYGIGDVDGNPELFDILRATWDRGIVPNITINGYRMQPEQYRQLADLCGAVSVSCYDRDVCFDAVERLIQAGLQQVNIHQLASEETYQDCLDLLDAAHRDPRLQGMRAIVLLQLKPVGRGQDLTPLRNVGKYKTLAERALQHNVGLGFDSCSAALFLKAMEDHPARKLFEMLAEPCESSLFSLYCSAEAKAYPCSFLERNFEGIDLMAAEDFIRDVWQEPRLVKWREELLATQTGGLVEGCRQCPAYNLYRETT